MHKIKSFHIPKIMLPFRKKVCYNTKVRRGVAQFGSALDWGSRGRKFKSCRSDHFLYSFAGGHAAFAKHPRGISSAGRAPGSQSGGQGFDPPMLHHVNPWFSRSFSFFVWLHLVTFWLHLYNYDSASSSFLYFSSSELRS